MLLTVDGHTYERGALERIARSHNPVSPMNREPFTLANLAPKSMRWQGRCQACHRVIDGYPEKTTCECGGECRRHGR